MNKRNKNGLPQKENDSEERKKNSLLTQKRKKSRKNCSHRSKSNEKKATKRVLNENDNAIRKIKLTH